MTRKLVVLALALSTLVHAQTNVPPIISQWAEAQKHMGNIVVDFKMNRSLPTLNDPINAEGHLWKLADGRFRWELGSPVTTVVLYDNTNMQIWESTQNTWQTLSPNDGRTRMWMQFLNTKEMSPEVLTKNFIPTVTAEAPDVVTVALQPKGSIVRKHLKQVDLQIDPRTNYLLQIRMIQGDDSKMMMTFGSPSPMAAADMAKFQAPTTKPAQ